VLTRRLVPTTIFREESRMKAAWPFSRLLALTFRVCLLSVVTLGGAGPLANAASQSAHVSSVVTQKFFCYTGLDHNECLQNITKLQAELVRYSPDLPKHWICVIVSS
jgi:hypothetical protein